ncbi:MAG TPA: putative DNA-binding domain-containing protein [Opitutus sp.]|nr:putative DNA-binding domain-containing protein [Opitutus sp.]
MKLSAAARADTPRHLLAFQRTLKDAIIRPLAPGDRTQEKWTDGRPTAELAAEFIKPNDRLTSLERLQIYNRMYWFRLLDCFYDDNPALRAAIGDRKLTRLAEAYLTKFPSSSFTLRNLCARLEQFIRREPKWTAPHTALAIDIARFEWAQTVAFDEPGRPVVAPEDFAGTPPSRLRLGLQPYISLLALNHPVDDYVIAIKHRDALRAEASNATTSTHRVARVKRIARPHRERVYVAVHRLDGRLYYKRLEPAAFKILGALREGAPLSRAIAAGGRKLKPAQARDWFATWMELGWFCRRS